MIMFKINDKWISGFVEKDAIYLKNSNKNLCLASDEIVY